MMKANSNSVHTPHNKRMKWIRQPVPLIACAITRLEPHTAYAGCYVAEKMHMQNGGEYQTK